MAAHEFDMVQFLLTGAGGAGAAILIAVA